MKRAPSDPRWQPSASWPRRRGRSVFRPRVRPSRCPKSSLTLASLAPGESWRREAPRSCRSWRRTCRPTTTNTVDAPATGGSEVGKPIDDITFVKTGHRERLQGSEFRDAKRCRSCKQPGIETHRRNAGERPQRRECDACRRSPRPSTGRFRRRRCSGAAAVGHREQRLRRRSGPPK